MSYSYNEITQLHKDILSISIINNDEDLTKISQLIITTQLNSIKCLSCRNVYILYNNDCLQNNIIIIIIHLNNI